MKRCTLLVLLASGCSAGDATVRIDIADLMQRAAQTEFQTAELAVTGDGVDILPQELVSQDTDPSTLSFEIDVPSGSDRTFAIEAYNGADTQRLTVYWGRTITDLAPGAVVEITIPVAPAGRISGIVALSDGGDVPPTQITCDRGDHQNSRLTGPFIGMAHGGSFSIPLPEGDYRVTATEVSVDGATYRQQEFPVIDITRGQSTADLSLVLDRVCVVGGNVECCGDGDCQTLGEYCLDTNQCGCAVGGAVQCCGDGDCATFCELATNRCDCEIGGNVECCTDEDCATQGEYCLNTNQCGCEVGGAIECCADTDCASGFEDCNLAANQCQATRARVQVVDAAGAPYTDGLAALVHDSAGTYLRQDVTDASGVAFVEVATGDMVSVLFDFTDEFQNTFYYVLTAAGVAPGDALPFRLPGDTRSTPPEVGHLAVSISTGPPAGTDTQWVSVAGSGTYVQLTVGRATDFTIFDNMLNGGTGRLDVIGWARDQSGTILGFATHPGLTPQPSGTLTIGSGGWDESPIALNLSFANVPVQQMLGLFMYQTRGGVQLQSDQASGITPASGSGSFYFPAGFFDTIDVIADVGPYNSRQSLARRFLNDTWPSPVTIDYNTFIAPIEPSSPPPSVDWTVPARPTVNWTTSALPATYDATLVSMDLWNTTAFRWRLVAPPGTVATVPDLSSAPSGFRPEDYQATFPMLILELRESSLFADYQRYLTTFGVRDQQLSLDLENWPEQPFTVRTSSYTNGG